MCYKIWALFLNFIYYMNFIMVSRNLTFILQSGEMLRKQNRQNLTMKAR